VAREVFDSPKEKKKGPQRGFCRILRETYGEKNTKKNSVSDQAAYQMEPARTNYMSELSNASDPEVALALRSSKAKGEKVPSRR
jgi:hypothetical protein